MDLQANRHSVTLCAAEFADSPVWIESAYRSHSFLFVDQSFPGQIFMKFLW